MNLPLNPNAFSTGRILTATSIDHLEHHLFDQEGQLQAVSSETLSSFTHNEIQTFCHKHGFYSLPSIELIQIIQHLIDTTPLDKVLEIGAGNGVYGRELGIRSTDNYMQHPKNKAKFKGVMDALTLSGQPPVTYGDNVVEMDGREAVRFYKPNVVVCSWVTHRYNPTQHHLGGNMYGVDFEWIIKRPHVKKVILIGNAAIHSVNPAMKLNPEIISVPDMMFSRSSQPDLDRIYLWDTTS